MKVTFISRTLLANVVGGMSGSKMNSTCELFMPCLFPESMKSFIVFDDSLLRSLYAPIGTSCLKIYRNFRQRNERIECHPVPLQRSFIGPLADTNEDVWVELPC